MKKTLSLILCAILVLGTVFTLCACDNDNGTVEGDLSGTYVYISCSEDVYCAIAFVGENYAYGTYNINNGGEITYVEGTYSLTSTTITLKPSSGTLYGEDMQISESTSSFSDAGSALTIDGTTFVSGTLDGTYNYTDDNGVITSYTFIGGWFVEKVIDPEVDVQISYGTYTATSVLLTLDYAYDADADTAMTTSSQKDISKSSGAITIDGNEYTLQ